MFYSPSIKFSHLLLLLFLGISLNLFATAPKNYASYDVKFYDLEIKLDAKFERIAGTSTIYFTLKQKLRSIDLDLDPFMEISHIVFKGKKIRYDHRQGVLKVFFPSELQAASKHKIEILFYGAPGASEKSLYSGGIMWQKNILGKARIFTRKGSRGTGCWWPHKYDPKDAADSMQFSIIYPRESQVTVPGKLIYTQILPGEFKRWTYKFKHRISCGSLQFGIGDILQARSEYQNKGRKYQLVSYTIPGQYTLAQKRLESIKKILSFMETYFGDYPFWDTGFHLFEPGFINASRLPLAEGAYNLPGTEAWLFDLVVSDWIGRSIMFEGEKGLWLQNMLKKYCESLYIAYLNGEDAGLKFLESNKDREDYMDAWLFHGLRHIQEDEQKWWDMLSSIHKRYKNRFMDYEDIFEHLYSSLGDENAYYWDQYFLRKEIPVLELNTKRKGKKMNISYRWAQGVRNFELPVDLWIFDEKHRLSPKAEWQVYSGKKVSEKHINVENPLGLFIVKRIKM